MKRRKLSFVIFLFQVCGLELINGKHHQGTNAKNKRSHYSYPNMLETNNYIGTNVLLKLKENLTNKEGEISRDKGCKHCHNKVADKGLNDYKMYNTDKRDVVNREMNKLNDDFEEKTMDSHKSTNHRLNKENILMKVKDSLGKYEVTGQNPYPPPNNNPYQTQSGVPYQAPPPDAYGGAPAPGPGQPQPYGYQNPNQYGQPQQQNPYQQPAQNNYSSPTPESYPQPGTLPQQAPDYSKPASAVADATGQTYPGQPNSAQYPDQTMAGQNPYNQQQASPYQQPGQGYQYPYQASTPAPLTESNDDVLNSWKCMFFGFFFDECKSPRQRPQYITKVPPMSPVAQQQCNMYGTSDLNLSDFKSNSNHWLLINQNNSIRLTSNKPVESKIQTLELKDNFCNKEQFSCTVQLGENSTAGLSVRGNDREKTLVELNALTKTISLKLVNNDTTQVLVEQPYPKLNTNFLHLVQVSDGGFQGTLSVSLDGETVFTKNDVPTQKTGSMGLFISSGNATFGNLSVTPVSS